MTLEAVALTNSLVRAKRQERYENSQRPPSRRPVWKQVLKGALPTIIIIAVGSVYLSVIHPRFAACRTDLQRSAVYFLAHHQRLARLLLRLVRMRVILYEIFLGEAGSVAASGDKVGENVKTSFATMRFIVTAGWSIYPLGYFFGYLLGSVDDDALNLVYNLADFINKIAFCLAIWACVKNDTRAGEPLLG